MVEQEADRLPSVMAGESRVALECAVPDQKPRESRNPPLLVEPRDLGQEVEKLGPLGQELNPRVQQ